MERPPQRTRKLPASRPRRAKSKVPAAETVTAFGPELSTDLAAAEQREWLVTNGLGGFASGTVAGPATRRYHGLLIAALDPPAARAHLVGGIDEVARTGGQSFELAAHRWQSGAVAPQGYRSMQRFRLEGTIPVWTYQVG